MFDIDPKGLAELEGGRPAYRLALEPVANVFDEFRGYGESERRKPSYCNVSLERSTNPRGAWLTVVDDGPGFTNEKDIYTLYGSTPKRSCTSVGGRFNLGEKQLIASAIEAKIVTFIDDKRVEVHFIDGERHIRRTQCSERNGTTVSAFMRWTAADLAAVREALCTIMPPRGLTYTVDGQIIARPATTYATMCTLPTVKLIDEVLRPTTGKTVVEVVAGSGENADDISLYELGIPVCSLKDIGFPYSLDVQQKVPVPISRDMVETSYLYKLIGYVLEQAALDSVQLLREDDQRSGFVKDALEYITRPEALEVVVKNLYGDNVVRQSSDPVANAKAAHAGATIIPGRWFGEATRKRLDQTGAMPTSFERFGGAESIPGMTPEVRDSVCPTCGGSGTL